MTPEELAAFALQQADLRNERRAVRLFHPEHYADCDRQFSEAVSGAARELAGKDETPRKAAARRR